MGVTFSSFAAEEESVACHNFFCGLLPAPKLKLIYCWCRLSLSLSRVSANFSFALCVLVCVRVCKRVVGIFASSTVVQGERPIISSLEASTAIYDFLSSFNLCQGVQQRAIFLLFLSANTLKGCLGPPYTVEWAKGEFLREACV